MKAQFVSKFKVIIKVDSVFLEPQISWKVEYANCGAQKLAGPILLNPDRSWRSFSACKNKLSYWGNETIYQIPTN